MSIEKIAFGRSEIYDDRSVATEGHELPVVTYGRETPIEETLSVARQQAIIATEGVWDAFANGSRIASRDVEDLLNGTTTLVELASARQFAGTLAPMRNAVAALNRAGEMLTRQRGARFANEYLHGVSDFQNLTSACANLTLRRLWDEECKGMCWESMVQDDGSRNRCEKRGTVAIRPIKAPANAGQPLGEKDGGLNYWQFGEITRGGYCISIYGDAVRHTMLLAECDKYGGLAGVLPWLARIQRDRKASAFASMLVQANGLNSGIFGEIDTDNGTYNNVIPTLDPFNGGPAFPRNPRPTNSIEASYLLQSLIPHINQQRDLDGTSMRCRDGWVLWTGDEKLACIFRAALQSPELMVSTTINGNEVSGTFSGCFGGVEVCVINEIADIATDPHPNGGQYWNHVWGLAPRAASGRKNAFQMANLNGFATPQFYVKRGEHGTLGGSLVQQLGQWDNLTQEYKVLIGYGFGSTYSEYAWGSDGTQA